MRSASPAMIQLLASGEFLLADLYRFTLVDGSVLALTAADRPLTVNGVTYRADIGVAGGQLKSSVGLDTDQQTLTIYPGATATVDGLQLLHRIRQGALDGASVSVERAVMPPAAWGDTSAGTVIRFVGLVAEIDWGRSKVDITVKSALERLDIQMPRNVYQPGCLHALYDTGCGVARAAYARQGVVIGANYRTITTDLGLAENYLAQGTILFTSGVNTGLTRTIGSNSAGSPQSIGLIYPLEDMPAAGDTFTAYPGCDRTAATCAAKFNNANRFRGFPYIPAPETAL